MRIGTKTLLYGNHQFILHPLMVGIAWVRIYHKLPNPKEAICIAIHDWGYWGKPNIDGPEGEQHPYWAANWAEKYLGFKYLELCQYHSSFLAKKHDAPVSRLCLPDKYGVIMTPLWLLVLLGRLTGETTEYRNAPKYAHDKRQNISDYQLYKQFREHYLTKVIPNLKQPLNSDMIHNIKEE